MAKNKTDDKTASAPAAPPARVLVKVRALRMGFVDRRRRPGEVFMVDERTATARWVERVPDDTPLLDLSPSDAARRAHMAAVQGPPRLDPVGMNPIVDTGDDEPTGKQTVL